MTAAPRADRIIVGLDRGTGRNIDDRTFDGSEFDLLLTTRGAPSRAWVEVAAEQLQDELQRLEHMLRSHREAALAFAQVLRRADGRPLGEALQIESLAYSMLLGGEDFRRWLRWRARRGAGASEPADGRRVLLERTDDELTIQLARPAKRNAIDARMRDALCEALGNALDDPTLHTIVLRGAGPDFCSGGDLDEFGSAPDPVTAHRIRMLRSPAALVSALGSRTSAYLHGACVGAGIEIPAAAGRVVATPDARFRLPELAMGLIPGAGGTATIARRIGRHRLLYWALSDRTIDAITAKAWGLIDAIEPAAGHTAAPRGDSRRRGDSPT